PFPEERIKELSEQVQAFIVPEINLGQISLEVERCAAGKAKTIGVTHAGGMVHNPQKILNAIIQGHGK
ncbi:MAG: 2-oxoacid:acceptor oxidoreductase subunit alpha, partial [Candidatus Neomarinimicrobiota bacterium]